MIYKIYLISFLLSFYSCNSQKKVCNTYGTKSSKNEVLFFASGGSAINNHEFYDLYLVITNYENKKWGVNDFMKIAQSYLDTTKVTTLPIATVTFVGQFKHDCIPDIYYEKLAEKYYVITLDFMNDEGDTVDYRKLPDFYLYKKGVAGDFVKSKSPEFNKMLEPTFKTDNEMKK